MNPEVVNPELERIWAEERRKQRQSLEQRLHNLRLQQDGVRNQILNLQNAHHFLIIPLILFCQICRH